MKVKICGIKNLEEAKIINETMPDFIGFVFAKSKREISVEKAIEIKKILNPKIKTVGVFVDKKIDEIIKYKNVIEFVQLHGEYDEDDIEVLKKEGFSVIKVVRVKENFYKINTKADFILFDTYSKTQNGGLNKTFNWDIKIETDTPYFIAGGLNEYNLKEAIEKLKPYGVDISSGAEEKGIKTKEKISNIMEIIKKEN